MEMEQTYVVGESERVYRIFDLYLYMDQIDSNYEANMSYPAYDYVVIYQITTNTWMENNKSIQDITGYSEGELFQLSTVSEIQIERVMKGQRAIKNIIENNK